MNTVNMQQLKSGEVNLGVCVSGGKPFACLIAIVDLNYGSTV